MTGVSEPGLPTLDGQRLRSRHRPPQKAERKGRPSPSPSDCSKPPEEEEEEAPPRSPPGSTLPINTMAPEDRPLLGRKAVVPPAPFTSALNVDSGDGSPRQLPQAIAHRGYKAAYPENTMGAFRGAISVGSHAIETDLHLSKDGVVVLSHDATLKRCFGRKEKVADCDWSYLSALRTLRPPHEPMPRLVDLLEYLAQPGLEDVWILLDVKRDDDPDELVRNAASVFASVPTPRAWKARVVFGCWNLQYIDLCKKYVPEFPTAYIGWSLPYAAKLLKEPNVNFNLLQQILVGPCGTRFIAAARDAHRRVFVWTVNEEEWMEWSIRKGVDGVITDDPELFLEVCDRWASSDPDGRSPPDGSPAGSPVGRVGAGTTYKRSTARPGRRRAGLAKRFGLMVQVVGIQVLTLVATALFLYQDRVMTRKQRRKTQS